MPANTYSCPKCKTVLTTAKPLAPGKKLQCPKCSTTFAIPGAANQAITKKPAPAPGRPVAGPRSLPGRKPAGAKEEDEGGAYMFVSDPVGQDEEDLKKVTSYEEPPPTINALRDAEVTVMKSSKLLMVCGILTFAINLGGVAFWVFPLLFTPHLIQAESVLYDDVAKKVVDKEWELIDQGEYKYMVPKGVIAGDLESCSFSSNKVEGSVRTISFLRSKEQGIRFSFWAYLGASVVGMIYGGLISMGAVKMQFVESWTFSLVACILALLPVSFLTLGLPLLRWALLKEAANFVVFVMEAVPGCIYLVSIMAGIQGIIILKRDDVREGFVEGAEAARKRQGDSSSTLLTAALGAIPVILVMVGVMMLLAHHEEKDEGKDDETPAVSAPGSTAAAPGKSGP